jgi:tRNA A-37 threonylcarbamoyl transferase component Bud32
MKKVLLALLLAGGPPALAKESSSYNLRFRVFPPDTQWHLQVTTISGNDVFSQAPVSVTSEEVRAGRDLTVLFKHPGSDATVRQNIDLGEFVENVGGANKIKDPEGDGVLEWPVEIVLPTSTAVAVWYRLKEHWWVPLLGLATVAGALTFAWSRQKQNCALEADRIKRQELAVQARAKNDPLVESQKSLGTYVIIDKLGEGGMATVYKAVPEATKDVREAVAIKLMKPELTRAEDRKRFLREIQVVRDLRHPHIVSLEAFGETPEDELWMAMELVPGVPLIERVRPGGLALSEVDGYVRPILDGLTYAHSRGVVHRDVKPHNVLIDDRGTLKIMDFGLARTHDASQVTATGTMLGSPSYVPPEQLTGGSLDPRSDQYSLGATLFELLTGRPPFERGDTMATLMAHMTEAPPSLRELRPDLPGSVERVVLRMLEKNPQARFADMAEVKRAWGLALQDPDAFAEWQPAVMAAARAAAVAGPAVTAELPPDGGEQTLY